MVEKFNPANGIGDEDGIDADFARRLARYRSRVAAEGRPRSLKLIDRAIRNAGKKGDRS